MNYFSATSLPIFNICFNSATWVLFKAFKSLICSLGITRRWMRALNHWSKDYDAVSNRLHWLTFGYLSLITVHKSSLYNWTLSSLIAKDRPADQCPFFAELCSFADSFVCFCLSMVDEKPEAIRSERKKHNQIRTQVIMSRLPSKSSWSNNQKYRKKFQSFSWLATLLDSNVELMSTKLGDFNITIQLTYCQFSISVIDF